MISSSIFLADLLEAIKREKSKTIVSEELNYISLILFFYGIDLSKIVTLKVTHWYEKDNKTPRLTPYNEILEINSFLSMHAEIYSLYLQQMVKLKRRYFLFPSYSLKKARRALEIIGFRSKVIRDEGLLYVYNYLYPEIYTETAAKSFVRETYNLSTKRILDIILQRPTTRGTKTIDKLHNAFFENVFLLRWPLIVGQFRGYAKVDSNPVSSPLPLSAQ